MFKGRTLVGGIVGRGAREDMACRISGSESV